jgi:hypothetical protein
VGHPAGAGSNRRSRCVAWNESTTTAPSHCRCGRISTARRRRRRSCFPALTRMRSMGVRSWIALRTQRNDGGIDRGAGPGLCASGAVVTTRPRRARSAFSSRCHSRGQPTRECDLRLQRSSASRHPRRRPRHRRQPLDPLRCLCSPIDTDLSRCSRGGRAVRWALHLILERPTGGAELGGQLVAKRFRLRGLGRVTVAMSLLGGPVVRLHLGGHALGISPESLVRGLL